MWTPRRQSIKSASSGHIETRYAANTVHLTKGPSYVDAVWRLLLRHAIRLRDSHYTHSYDCKTVIRTGDVQQLTPMSREQLSCRREGGSVRRLQFSLLSFRLSTLPLIYPPGTFRFNDRVKRFDG